METNVHLLICRWWLLIPICSLPPNAWWWWWWLWWFSQEWPLRDPDFEKYSCSQGCLKKNNPIKTPWNPMKNHMKTYEKLWNPMKNEIFTISISIDRWIVDYPSLGIKRHIVSWLGCPSSPPKRIVIIWFLWPFSEGDWIPRVCKQPSSCKVSISNFRNLRVKHP